MLQITICNFNFLLFFILFNVQVQLTEALERNVIN